MTLTIEVDDDKALNELKDFLELKKKIRVIKNESNDAQIERSTPLPQKEMTDEERRTVLRSLRGSLNMSPERLKEFEAFLHEIRNEWE